MSNPYVAIYNEHADYGVAYSRTFQHLDDNGSPISNVGKTAVAAVRSDYGQTPVWSTVGGSITVVLGGADGKVTISITEAHMRDITSAASTEWEGVFDVVLESGGEAYLKLIQGSFTVHPTSAET